MYEQSSFFFGTFVIFAFWMLLVLPVIKVNLKRSIDERESLDYRIKRSVVFEDVLKQLCVFVVSLIFLLIFLTRKSGDVDLSLVFFLVLALIPLWNLVSRRVR